MTKTKKKKMSKSTFAIIIMAIAMVAMLAFGGTYAYFTATATTKTTGEFTTGSIKLEANDDKTFVASLTNVVPGDELSTGALTLTPTSSGTDSYIAIRVTITAKNSSTPDLDLTGTSLESPSGLLSSTPYTGSTWVAATESGYETVFVLAATTTPTPVPSTEVDSPVIINITGDKLVFTADDEWIQDNDKEGYISESKLMGATLNITIEARSVQSDNWNDGSEDASATGAAATVNGIAKFLFPAD